MANYVTNQDEKRVTDLLEYGPWHIVTKEEYDREAYDEPYEELLENQLIPLYLPEKVYTLEEIVENGDLAFPETEGKILLSFCYDSEETPIACQIWYPAYDENDPYMQDGVLELNPAEKEYFSKLLQQALI